MAADGWAVRVSGKAGSGVRLEVRGRWSAWQRGVCGGWAAAEGLTVMMCLSYGMHGRHRISCSMARRIRHPVCEAMLPFSCRNGRSLVVDEVGDM